MEDISVSSGMRAPYLGTNNQVAHRRGFDTQVQAPSQPAGGIQGFDTQVQAPSQPAGGIQGEAQAREGWWISLMFGWILALLDAIFRQRQQDKSAQPTSSPPQPTSSPPAPSSTSMTIGNNNSNVGNTNNSHNNSTSTTTINGPVGALGDHASAKWDGTTINYGRPT